MALDKEKLLGLYRDMVMIRRFEEVIQEYAANGTIPGFVHLGIGQEACQAGVMGVLRKTDYKFPDHRCHGLIALCGTEPKRVMAEIFGRATGVNGGTAGSMHVNDYRYRNMGMNGIEGSTMVTALGTAFSAKYNKTDDVTAIIMGDGTLGEGTCHESLNLSATWKLPLVYVLVNNHYAISTHYHRSHPQKELKTWAQGYEVPSARYDGNDVEAVVEAMQEAVARARRGDERPLELMTYRWQGHFAGPPAAYRPDEEVSEWKAKDPLKITRDVLKNREKVAEAVLKELEAEVREDVGEMLKFCLESPLPDPAAPLKYVYADREIEVPQ